MLPRLQREVGAAEAGVFEGQVPRAADDVLEVALRRCRIGDLRGYKRRNETHYEEGGGAAPPRRRP